MPPARTWDVRFRVSGTRFLIFPQPRKLRGFGEPETVYVNRTPGTIRPGPEDDRVYVVYPEAKDPYKDEETGRLLAKPPFLDARYPPAEPGPDGHFDHLKPETRGFSSATVYAIVNCVLETWESYFGHQLPWHFLDAARRRLEVITRVDSTTAWSGDGYVEFGSTSDSNLFCENFDVVAHEMGHLIGWAVIGRPHRRSMDYRSNDEACADLMAIVASLHCGSMLDHLLEHTKGNLFSKNELSRVGEMVPHYRRVYNVQRMSTARKKDGDLQDKKYQLSLPFTGGAFDVLVGIYEQCLVDRGIIPAELARRSYHPRRREIEGTRRQFVWHFERKRGKFKEALIDARDYFGTLMARALDRTAMHARSHAMVASNFIKADAELSGGRFATLIRRSFHWREILGPA